MMPSKDWVLFICILSGLTECDRTKVQGLSPLELKSASSSFVVRSPAKGRQPEPIPYERSDECRHRSNRSGRRNREREEGRGKREEGRGKNEVSRDLSYPFIPLGKEPILICAVERLP